MAFQKRKKLPTSQENCNNVEMGKKEDEQEKASPAYTVTKIWVYSRGISHSAFRNENEYLMHN